MAENRREVGTPIFAQIAADHKRLKEIAQERGEHAQLKMDIARLKAVKTIGQLATLIETMERELANKPRRRK
jgi:hypothetical protein